MLKEWKSLFSWSLVENTLWNILSNNRVDLTNLKKSDKGYLYNSIELNSLEKDIINIAEVRQFLPNEWEWHSDDEDRLIYWFNEKLPKGFLLGELRILGKIISIRNGAITQIPVGLFHQVYNNHLVNCIVLKTHSYTKELLVKGDIWVFKKDLTHYEILELVWLDLEEAVILKGLDKLITIPFSVFFKNYQKL